MKLRIAIAVGALMLAFAAGHLSAQPKMAFYPAESYEVAAPSDGGRMCGPKWDATTTTVQVFVLKDEPWLLTRCDSGRIFVHRLAGQRE